VMLVVREREREREGKVDFETDCLLKTSFEQKSELLSAGCDPSDLSSWTVRFEGVVRTP